MSDPVQFEKKMSMEGFSIDRGGLAIRPVKNRGKIMLQRSNIVTDSEMEGLGRNFTQAFGSELPLQVCQKSPAGLSENRE